MYWKFCEMAALGKLVVPGCWSTTLGAGGVDCANTGALQATQAAAAAAGMIRFIEWSFVWSIEMGGVVRREFRPHSATMDCQLIYKHYPI